MKSCLIRCQCGNHVIAFDYDDDGYLFIQLWPNEMSLWKRIKFLFGKKEQCIGETVIKINDLKDFIEFFKYLEVKVSDNKK